MSDEKKELTDELMGKVAGGKIYYDDSKGGYVVYNDDGTVAGNYKNQEEAMFHAVGEGTCPYCGKVLSKNYWVFFDNYLYQGGML